MRKINKLPPSYDYHDYTAQRTQLTRIVVKQVRDHLLRESLSRKEVYDKRCKAKDVKIGQKVYVLRNVKEGPLFKVSSKFTGPYRVVEILGKGKVKVKDLTNFSEKVVHLDLVKLIPNDVDPFYKECTNEICLPQISEPRNDQDAVSARTRSKSVKS